MIALVDANSFFCSVEKVFHPGLRGKPVCVLSSNDGNIVALTPEAKALGLRRGDPLFKVRHIVEQHQVALFSSNMMLYAAMSRRVIRILRRNILHVENYSIDESFCYLDGYERFYSLEAYMRGVVEQIRTWTDIPVSVGIAATKTLAKVGSKFAKQYPGFQSVCLIDTEEKRRKALSLFPLDEVWGIGRSTLSELNYLGISTPLQFADRSEGWVRSHFQLPGVRTWMELNGKPCIDTAEVMRNQSVCTSRSFGEMVEDLPHLKEAVIHFAGSCANKLRGQRTIAGAVTVFLTSNRFRQDLQQYSNAATRTLLVRTSDTLEIVNRALDALKEIYRPGIWYKKCGVVLSDITPDKAVTWDLFDPITNRKERDELMATIDRLNQRYGLKSVHLAGDGSFSSKGPHDEPAQQPWRVKSEHRSGDYLTDINGLLTIEI